MESWAGSVCMFPSEPLEIRVIVQPAGGRAGDPVFRSQGRLLSIVSDSANFGMADLDAGFGYVVVSEETVRDRRHFRWFFLEALAYTMLAQQRVTPLHAACVERSGYGVLLCGSSGAGKSTLAFACARAGWTYTSDDASLLVNDGTYRTVVGRSDAVRLRRDAPRQFDCLAGHAAQIHPNGKPTIELSLVEFEEVRTSARCQVDAVVLLERGRKAELAATPPEIVVDLLLREIGSFGADVRQRHARAITALASREAYRLRYTSTTDALALLNDLAGRRGIAHPVMP